MFSFKQFTVHQQHCAMKVCTDACLFGAWAAAKAASMPIKNVLDIGTGTGLLSLMLAQKLEGNFHAVEINEKAAAQAAENFSESPWNQHLQVFHSDILAYNPSVAYDMIITNPPFFESDLRSADKEKNAAKHDTTLLLQELLAWIARHLTNAGVAAILIPAHRIDYLNKIARQEGLWIIEKMMVRQTPTHAFFRAMLLLSKKEGKMDEGEMFIHNDAREYSAEFVELLKDYYLKL